MFYNVLIKIISLRIKYLLSWETLTRIELLKKKVIAMKKRVSVILIIGLAGSLAACGGDHSTRSNIDTVKNRYGSELNDTTGVSKKTIDTSKVTATTGDASDLDNSGSGGTKAEKDTTKKSKK